MMRILYELVGELDMGRWRWLDVITFYSAAACLLGETIAMFAAPGVIGQREPAAAGRLDLCLLVAGRLWPLPRAGQPGPEVTHTETWSEQ